jgi:hypothetical protein
VNQPKPKETLRFYLRTGEEKPADKKIPGLTISPKSFGDSQRLYSISRLGTTGEVEVNTEIPEYRYAIDIGDEHTQIVHECLVVSMAISEFAFPGENNNSREIHTQALFERTYQAVQREQGGGKSRVKKTRRS